MKTSGINTPPNPSYMYAIHHFSPVDIHKFKANFFLPPPLRMSQLLLRTLSSVLWAPAMSWPTVPLVQHTTVAVRLLPIPTHERHVLVRGPIGKVAMDLRLCLRLSLGLSLSFSPSLVLVLVLPLLVDSHRPRRSDPQPRDRHGGILRTPAKFQRPTVVAGGGVLGQHGRGARRLCGTGTGCGSSRRRQDGRARGGPRGLALALGLGLWCVGRRGLSAAHLVLGLLLLLAREGLLALVDGLAH